MNTPNDIERAVKLLAAGALVGLPTETVYGLAGDATQAKAVRQIFALKGRPAKHPVIVHLCEAEQMREWAREIPQLAWELAKAFWPGPMTLILPRHPSVLDEVTGGHSTVGLRVPSHPVAQELLVAFGAKHSGALAAPSANRFGRVSPTKAAHVRAEFGDALPLVLEGGACEVGIESTIIDLSGARPSVLRPGQLDLESLSHLFDDPQAPEPRLTPAPGTLASHYAVKVPTFGQANLKTLPTGPGKRGWIGCTHPPGLVGDWELEVLGSDAASFARGFYQAMRRLEAAGVQEIYIQALPEGPAWQGVVDRVSRACVAWENQSRTSPCCP